MLDLKTRKINIADRNGKHAAFRHVNPLVFSALNGQVLDFDSLFDDIWLEKWSQGDDTV